MNITRFAILGVALIAGIAAAMLMYGMLGGGTPPTQAAAPPTTTTVDVLVASKDIAPGHALDADLVRWEAWPKGAASGGLITRAAQPDIAKAVAGAVVRAPLVSGQPITDASIVRAGSAGFMAATIKPGMRAVGVPVTAETSAGGFILPNDRVDVVLTRDMSGGSGAKNFESRTILRDVRVLAIDQTAHQEKDQQSVVGKTATLELSPQQAELVAQSQQMGVLSLALRALGDSKGEAVAGNAPPSRRPVSFPVASGTRATVEVFRYGVLRSAETGPGAPAAGGAPAAPATATASANASPSASDISGITNPVHVTVTQAPVLAPVQ